MSAVVKSSDYRRT